MNSEYGPGDIVLVYSLGSDDHGGFLNGKEAMVVEGENDDGFVKVAVLRNFSGTYKLDSEYAVFPEQLRRLDEDDEDIPPFRKNEEVFVYAAQTFGCLNLARGTAGRVYRDQIGGSVIVDTFTSVNRDHHLEVYPEQLRRHPPQLSCHKSCKYEQRARVAKKRLKGFPKAFRNYLLGK